VAAAAYPYGSTQLVACFEMVVVLASYPKRGFVGAEMAPPSTAAEMSSVDQPSVLICYSELELSRSVGGLESN